MRTKILFLLCLFIWCKTISAQIPDSITVTYSSYFAFEDAIGNTDTVFFYGKTTGSPDNPGYIGDDIGDEPFDEVFEVRIGDGWILAGGSDDPIICPSYSTCFSPPSNSGGYTEPILGGITFMVKARHWPITVSWDTLLFQRQDEGGIWGFPGSVLVNHVFHYSVYEWWKEPQITGVESQYACLTGYDSWTFTNEEFPAQEIVQLQAIHPYGDPSTVDTITRLSVDLLPFDVLRDSCIYYDDLISSLNPATKNGQDVSGGVRLYPNPTETSAVYVDLRPFRDAQHLQITLQSNTGQRIRAWDRYDLNAETPLRLDIGQMPPGLYHLLIADEEGRFARRKLVRQ